MKSAKPNARAGSDGLNSLSHFAGSFIGEGQRKDGIAGNALRKHVSHTPGNDSRFARTSCGDDQQRAFDCRHSITLGWGQVI
jgi:hypothetical protein